MRKLIVIAVLFMAQGGWAIYHHEDFDTLPAGYVTDCPDWESTLGHGNRARAVVGEGECQTLPQALELQHSPEGFPQAAVYSGVGFRYHTGNPVIHLAFKLYRDTVGQNVQIHLADDDTSILQLSTDDDGTVLVTQAGATYDTDRPFITGRFVPFDLYYDANANLVSLDMDGQNIMAWRRVSPSALVQFNRVWFVRVPLPGGNQHGAVRFDNLTIETFPASTWAWWRFEDGDGSVAADHLGHVTTPPTGTDDLTEPSAWGRLLAGSQMVRNRGASSPTAWPAGFAGVVRPLGVTPEWTLELIVRIDAQPYNATLFEWAVGTGPITSGESAIVLRRYSALMPPELTHVLELTLADQTNENGTHVIRFADPLPDDRAWHHLAFVKFQNNLEYYLDYQLKQYVELLDSAKGEYSFGTDSQVSIGHALTSSERMPGAFDEVRFSTEPLQASAFLRLPAPRIKHLEVLPGQSVWRATLETVPFRGLRLERRRFPATDGSWTEVEAFFPQGLEHQLDITLPTSDTGVFRLRMP